MKIFFIVSILCVFLVGASISNEEMEKMMQYSQYLREFMMNFVSDPRKALNHLLSAPNGLSSAQRAAIMAITPDESLATLLHLCSPKDIESMDKVALLTFVEKSVDPSLYLITCRHEPHVSFLTEAVLSRIMDDQQFHTCKVFVNVLHNVVLNDPNTFNPMSGNCLVPNIYIAAKVILVLHHLLKNDQVRQEYSKDLKLSLFGQPKRFKIVDDYISGRAYAALELCQTFREKDHRIHVGFLAILPRVMNDEIVRLFKSDDNIYPDLILFIDKLSLLHHTCDPIRYPFGPNHLSESDFASVERILLSIREQNVQDYEDLRRSLEFADSAHFVSPHAQVPPNSFNWRELSKMNPKKLAELYMTPHPKHFMYGKRIILAVVKSNQKNDFEQHVIKYAQSNEDYDEEALTEYIKLCSNPKLFLSLPKHSVPIVEASINRMFDLKLPHSEIVDHVLMPMIITQEQKSTPLFGKFTAPDRHYLKAISEHPLFHSKEAIAHINNTLQTMMTSAKCKALRDARRNYCTTIINLPQANDSTVVFTESQLKGNVLLLKILPFVIPSSLFEHLYQTRNSEDKKENIALVHLLSFHEPTSLHCDRSFKLPVLREFGNEKLPILSNLSNLSESRLILRSIVRSQPKAFLSLMKNHAFELYPFTDSVDLSTDLAQDFLSRAFYNDIGLKPIEHVVKVIMVCHFIRMQLCLFDYTKANEAEKKLLVKFELETEMTVLSMLKMSDKDIYILLSLYFRCAQDHEQLEDKLSHYLDLHESEFDTKNVRSIMSIIKQYLNLTVTN